MRQTKWCQRGAQCAPPSKCHMPDEEAGAFKRSLQGIGIHYRTQYCVLFVSRLQLETVPATSLAMTSTLTCSLSRIFGRQTVRSLRPCRLGTSKLP